MSSELELDSDYEEVDKGFNYKYKPTKAKVWKYIRTMSYYDKCLWRRKYALHEAHDIPWLKPVSTLPQEVEQRLYYSFKSKYMRWKYSLRRHHIAACQPTKMELARRKYRHKLYQSINNKIYFDKRKFRLSMIQDNDKVKKYITNLKMFEELIKRINNSETWFPSKRNVTQYNTWMNSNHCKPKFELSAIDGILPVLQFIKKQKIFKLQNPSNSMRYSAKLKRKLLRKYLNKTYPI